MLYYLDDVNNVSFYTASLSPHLQGVEITETWQINSYTNIKIRSHSDIVVTLNGIEQSENNFNDEMSSENMGVLNSGSQVNLDTRGKISQKVSHKRLNVDLGKSLYYQNEFPFSDSETVELSATDFIKANNNNNFPYELNSASTQNLMDGVIEPLSIRRIIDRKNRAVSYIENSINSEIFFSKNQIGNDFISIYDNNLNPYTDKIRSFGNIDIPSSGTTFINNFPFYDDDQLTLNYNSINDSQIKYLLIGGFTSGSIEYKAKRCEMIDNDKVYSRRGFCFSEEDNYKFDSITFAGLNRRTKTWT